MRTRSSNSENTLAREISKTSKKQKESKTISPYFKQGLSSSGSDSDHNFKEIKLTKKNSARSKKRPAKSVKKVSAKRQKILDKAEYSHHFEGNSSPSKSGDYAVSWDDGQQQKDQTDAPCQSQSLPQNDHICSESDDEEDAWEEVAEIDDKDEEIEVLTQENTALTAANSDVIPKDIEITINNNALKSKCKTRSLNELLQQELAKKNRLAQESLHKTHILALTAHGVFVNKLGSLKRFKALALSLLSPDLIRKSDKHFDLKDFKQFVSWFKDTFSFDSSQKSDDSLIKRIGNIFSTKTTATRLETVLLIVIFLRLLHVNVRLVLALNPISLKVTPPKNTKKPVSSKLSSSSPDPDFKKSAPSKKIKNTKSSNRQVLSSDSDEEVKLGPGNQVMYWIEIFLPSDKKWACYDYFSGILDNPRKLASSLIPSQCLRLLYVLGFSGNQSIKDLSGRYDIEWATKSRKLRVSDDWWSSLLASWKSNDTELEAIENEEIHNALLKLPLPVKMDDFKGNPLYRLRRHLLKYEVIYPDTALPLGFIKSEPIYAREVVHVCHTRETWLKDARVVRLGEEPIKKVKAKMSLKRQLLQEKEPQVDLYGPWQTEPYDPPVAENGVVPKNEHGNVELYKPCMMPIGCVHLDLPGLSRIAKKLTIDIAPAMMGWEFHPGGWAHPLLKGWIVCEEMAPVLKDAWVREEGEKMKKADEARSKRALLAWKRLVKALMIRERLRRMYDLEGSAELSRVSSIANQLAKLRQERLPTK